MSAAVRAPITKRLVLSPSDRETLEGWARRAKTSQALALRARIVLACADEHRPDTQIAATSASIAVRLRSGADALRRKAWRGSWASRARGRLERLLTVTSRD